MPHIVFTKENIPTTPFSYNGVDFKFCTQSFNLEGKQREAEYKLAVEYEKKEFLLTLKNKNGDFIIKPDKITRVTPIQIIKDALNAYVQSTQANIVFTNTANINNTVEPQKEYLKEIEYFASLST